LGIKPITLRQYIGFVAVPDSVKELIPKIISKSDAIRLCKVVTNVPKALDLAYKISKYDSASKKRYLVALKQLGSTADHFEIMHLTNQFRAKQNISMKISKKQAKGLAKIASVTETEPQEFAKKIITDYLKRRGY